MDEKIEPFYQIRAKEIVDMLFDKGYFKEDVSRDGMNDVESFLAWSFQVQCESAKRIALLIKQTKDRKDK
jgi:hypothetical protein